MSEENVTGDSEPSAAAPARRPTLSTSTSSLDRPTDAHDPHLNQLATAAFAATANYIRGESDSVLDHYRLLEEMNRLTLTKYADMSHIAANLSKCIADYNVIYARDIEPYLRQADAIEENVERLEQAAYKLDNYTKLLQVKFKNICKR